MTSVPAQAIGDVQIRPYRADDWEQVCDFTRRNWRADHPLCNRRLFEWQFKGFGNEANTIASLLMWSGGTLIGFRGIIPGLYQVPTPAGGMAVLPGGSLAMWMISPEFRGTGLGGLMHQAAQRTMPVITGMGSNPATSIPIYVKNGFAVLESMHRYIVPLAAERYAALLAQRADPDEICEWAGSLTASDRNVGPRDVDIDALAAAWQDGTFPVGIFSLYRSPAFWRWRYLDSAGFRYLFFGEPRQTGAVIARIEKVHSTERPELHGETVLRIIEVVPRDSSAWSRGIDERLVDLIQGATRWARHQGCAAADFLCSTARLAPVMAAAGFREQDSRSHAASSLAMLFRPLTFTARPLNALIRVEIPGSPLPPIDFDDTYLVKSDNDMDRPNLHAAEEVQ
jgi:hypothetical protein